MTRQEEERYNYAPPINMPSPKADLLDKIQPTLILDIIYHNLMGEQFIDGIWVKDKELMARSLTKKGSWDIRTLMTPVSSQNVSLSKLKDHEIRARALHITNALNESSLRNWKEYGIKGADQINFIHQIVFSNSFITLKQPEGEGIRNMIKNIGNADIGYQEEEQPTGWNTFRR